jgi:nucleotide-binding universal stress UspA family protein
MKILLAVDGSEHSEAALQALAARPWPAGTTVAVLSVASRPWGPPPPGPAWDSVTVVPDLEPLRAHAAGLAERAAETLRGRGLAAEHLVRTGDAGNEIVEAAEEWHADLVFVGSRGLTGLKRLIMGSVAQYVVGHACCSVEVVHRPEAGAPAVRKAG